MTNAGHGGARQESFGERQITVSLDLCPVTIARKEKDLLKKISVNIIP